MDTARSISHYQPNQLVRTSFLGPDGKPAKKRRHIASAIVEFDDGKSFHLPRHELNKLPGFNMEPKRNGKA